MTSFSGATFVLFCFVFVVMLSLKPRPFVQSSFDMRDGTAEPVSRDQILRHERGQGNIHFSCSADHVQDWQPYRVHPYSRCMCDHTYIHTGAPIATCVSFFLFSFCLFGDVAFSEYFLDHCRFLLEWRVRLYALFFRIVFFYLATTGWIFVRIQQFNRSITVQSTSQRRAGVMGGSWCGNGEAQNAREKNQAVMTKDMQNSSKKKKKNRRLHSTLLSMILVYFSTCKYCTVLYK